MTTPDSYANDLPSYCEDTQSRLDEIASILIEIEAGRKADVQLVHEAIRQIRQGGEIFGLDPVVLVCGLMVDYLAKTPPQQLSENVQVLLDACDFISVYVDALAGNQNPPQISSMILEGLRHPSEPYVSEFSEAGADGTVPNRPRFLIADDDPQCRQILKSILAPFGVCDLVENGRQAVEAVQKSLVEKRPYAAVCLDIRMPEMDGHLALKLIRCCENEFQIFGSAGAKIFMISVLGGKRHRARAFKAGCQTYLTKPVDPDRLIDTMRRMGVFWDTRGDRKALRFRDKDVSTVILMPGPTNMQESEVADESHTGIGLLVEDVSQLCPGQEVELMYMGAPQRAVVRCIQPPNQDGRSHVGFQWM